MKKSPKNNLKKLIKKLTIDDLARMVQNGFLETAENLNRVRKELKVDIEEVRIKLEDDIAGVKVKVDNIERYILQQQNSKIQDLEVRMRNVEGVLLLDK